MNRGGWWLRRHLLQGRNDLVWIEPKDFRKRREFHDSDAPLSTFEAGVEGLRFPQAGRKIGLHHSRCLSPCDEEVDQGLVTFRSACFANSNPAKLTAESGINLLLDYLKFR
jgi:hypothetical protein